MKNRVLLLFILGMVVRPLTTQAQHLESYLVYAAANNPGLKAKYAGFEA